MLLLVQGPGSENTGLEIVLWFTSPVPSLYVRSGPKRWWWWWWGGVGWSVEGRWDYFLSATRMENKNQKNIFSLALDEEQYNYGYLLER